MFINQSQSVMYTDLCFRSANPGHSAWKVYEHSTNRIGMNGMYCLEKIDNLSSETPENNETSKTTKPEVQIKSPYKVTKPFLGALHMIPVEDEIGFCSCGDFQPAFRDEKFVTRPFRREI